MNRIHAHTPLPGIAVRLAVGVAASIVLALLVLAPSATAKTVIPKPKSSANPVTYGKSVQITGSLNGNPSANLPVALQANAFPFAGYVDVATAVSSATGAYAFTVTPLINTRYRVVTTGASPDIGDEITQVVAQKVTFKVSDRTPKRRASVRFYGSVTPANDGAYVALQKRTTTGAFATVTRIRLVDAGDSFSRFSRKIRVSRNGVYRVVATATPSLGEGVSTTRSLRVH